jgi:hypothetical protein
MRQEKNEQEPERKGATEAAENFLFSQLLTRPASFDFLLYFIG